MKTAAIIVVLILLAIAGILLLSPKAPQDVQQLQVGETPKNAEGTQVGSVEGKVELTDFSFVGYGPGKSHTGVFEKYEIKNVKVNSAGVPVAGEIVVDASSVKTDTAMLDTHLKEKVEFFDVAKYPTITFTFANATETGDGIYQVSGDLKLKDVSKRVSFAVNSTSEKTFTAEFRLNMKDFGFSAPGIVDEEVLVKFAGKLI